VFTPTPCSKQDHFQRQIRLIWAFSSQLLNTSRCEDSPGSLESLVRALHVLIDLNGLTSLTWGPHKYSPHSSPFSAQLEPSVPAPATLRVLVSSSATAFPFPWPWTHLIWTLTCRPTPQLDLGPAASSLWTYPLMTGLCLT